MAKAERIVAPFSNPWGRVTMRGLSTLPIVLLLVAPLILSLLMLAPAALGTSGLAALNQHPQFPGALRLTLFSGLVSTGFSLLFALTIIMNVKASLSTRSGIFLSVPHLAFAIGLGFLIMPTGLLARLMAPVAGFVSPPAWVTTQDPYGLALTLALALKETPFLVWAFAAILNRDDLKQNFAKQRAVAASLGHSPRSTFLRVILPQVLPRAIWPLVAVLAYGLTVVDMALVIGPTQPPTLAQLIWTDLNDADVANNARGSAGVMVLSGIIILIVIASALALKLTRPWITKFWSHHPERGTLSVLQVARSTFSNLLLIIYAAVFSVLIIQSFAGLWPFPAPLPEHFSLAAWQRLVTNISPITTSLILAILTASLSSLASVAWLESVPPSNDRYLLWLAALVLCLPALVIGLGQYRLFLLLGITGTNIAMFFAHVLPVCAYVFIMLQGPYRGFDQRFHAAASGLRVGRVRFLREVKWPMLKAPLLSAFAVGFAVSIAQYVPAQLAAAGRFSTLPMEAVTLTSGGNRALTAAYGLALMALPLIVFVTAGLLGRPRWKTS